jgi:hypothetical protein
VAINIILVRSDTARGRRSYGDKQVPQGTTRHRQHPSLERPSARSAQWLLDSENALDEANTPEVALITWDRCSEEGPYVHRSPDLHDRLPH